MGGECLVGPFVMQNRIILGSDKSPSDCDDEEDEWDGKSKQGVSS